MKKEIKLLIEMLNKRSHIIFAYLFGSRVKGYANEMSDWDIAIYLKTPLKESNRWPAFELEAEVSRIIGGTIQVIVLNNPLSPVFAFEILKDGIVLLDRDPNLRMDFENRMLRYYYDWQYFLKRQMEAERRSRRIEVMNP
jgi:predicted nucleotidyltransferase